MQESGVTEKNEESGITLSEIFFNIKKRIVVVLLCIAVGCGVGVLYYKLQPVKYVSTGTMLIDYDNLLGGGSNIYTEYANAEQIAETFTLLVSHDVVLDKVVEEFAEENLTAQRIRNNLSVSYESLLITVEYTDYDSVRAQKVVNSVMENAKIVSDSTGEGGEPLFKTLYESLSVMMEGKEGRVAPKSVAGLLLFALGGFVVAAIYVAVRMVTDKKFKSESEVERVLNIPVLAGVPYYELEPAEGKDGEVK